MATSFTQCVDFSQLDSLPDYLHWLHEPPTHDFVSRGDRRASGLRVMPAGKTDFWQKTFYTPLLEKCNGVALLRAVPQDLAHAQWSAEVCFSIEDTSQQFDQAGLMVYYNHSHWMKAGIEVVDDSPQLSCVMTSYYSDWSVLPWDNTKDGKGLREVSIRVSFIRDSFAVEYCRDGCWSFYRIAPNMVGGGGGGEGGRVRVGVYCCAPTEAGMAAIFHRFSTSEEVKFKHHS